MAKRWTDPCHGCGSRDGEVTWFQGHRGARDLLLCRPCVEQRILPDHPSPGEPYWTVTYVARLGRPVRP